MQDNIVLLSFTEASKAYQALAEMKQAAVADRVNLLAAAVVERDDQGALRIRDGSSDGAAASAPLVGTMLGSLLGVLGGPLGVLLMGTSGTMLGSLAAIDVVARRSSVLEQMTQALQPGTTALVASVAEGAVEVVDGIANNLGATVLRRPTDAVMAEVEAAAEAQDAAAREAQKVLHAKQRAEWRDKMEGWKDEAEAQVKSWGEKIKKGFQKA